MKIDGILELAEMPNVLVVDDDERLRTLLSKFLGENELLVTTAVDAKDARAKIESLEFDIVIMDVMMPGEDGVECTASLKQDGFKSPVILLTALGDVEDRIKGLESGADDYLPKPFEPRELLLRINAILKRVQSAPVVKEDPKIGKWLFDQERGELVADEERLPLTQVENTLLKALYNKRNEVVGREDLAETCGVDASERTIDVQITRLRKRIEEDTKAPKYIQTVRGKGYVLRLG